MPENGEEGQVDRATAIKVMRAHGIEVSLLPETEGHTDMMLIVKGDIIEVKKVPPVLGRRLIHYLSRKYDVPIHHFYNPLMAPPTPEEPIN